MNQLQAYAAARRRAEAKADLGIAYAVVKIGKGYEVMDLLSARINGLPIHGYVKAGERGIIHREGGPS